ncbi:hypothetical protein B0H13DRAFT_2581028 [Mycena leptocephala]|nr:hypothetical protein B0H13DRAFT_2581028 [Mycena leptocephala]
MQSTVMIERCPGFHSQITCFSADGVGIAVLTNDNFGEVMKEVIKFRIINEIFGLDPMDWDSRCALILFDCFHLLPKVNVVSAPTLDIKPDYRWPMPTPPSTPALPNTSLPLPFAAMQGAYRNRGYGRDIMFCMPTTAAAHCRTDHFDLSYVTLTHFEGAVFNLMGWVVAPTGNASAPLFTYGPIGEGEPKGNTVEARSEVWFDALGI